MWGAWIWWTWVGEAELKAAKELHSTRWLCDLGYSTCTVQITCNLTNECVWHTRDVALLASQFPAPACTRTCTCIILCMRSRGHTQVLEIRRQKIYASYIFTASLHSTSLLKRSKSLVPRRVTVLAITFTSTRDSLWQKDRELEASLCLANLLLPLCAQQTHQCSSKRTISA